MPQIGQAPGWYGKLPQLGDFARRRLPSEFIGPWDDWLQQGLQSSRAALGEAWLEHYLGAPVWRFVLLPGVIEPDAWAGVLMPSVDRVGRYFPLTLCTSLKEDAPLGPSLTGLDSWLAGLETCALLALDAERGLDRMEVALQELPACPGAVDPDPAGPNRPAAGFLDGLGARILPRALAGNGFWWQCDLDGGCIGFVQPGLPSPSRFAEMLSGRPSQQAATTA
ncbi:type VI secretion system-associated protein TagF [Malikia sp.]|uniref:type VI secretion system-associated protein TagF n=1 Tax=Malikia sp. TaxID=2070706 RepID=UPI0026177B61|nr:type VI secretion system-associated protein TagF [Malikia sp.]MDD2728817.1 type VI secretion system-associated protein TagF [Malikia sp.]